jgi:hypothetical protein
MIISGVNPNDNNSAANVEIRNTSIFLGRAAV